MNTVCLWRTKSENVSLCCWSARENSKRTV